MKIFNIVTGGATDGNSGSKNAIGDGRVDQNVSITRDIYEDGSLISIQEFFEPYSLITNLTETG